MTVSIKCSQCGGTVGSAHEYNGEMVLSIHGLRVPGMQERKEDPDTNDEVVDTWKDITMRANRKSTKPPVPEPHIRH